MNPAQSQSFSLKNLTSVLLLLALSAPQLVSGYAYEYAGCFASLDGFTSKGTNIYQTSLACSSSCSGYSYFALTNGNTCYCGNSAPSGNEGTCTTGCMAWASEPCGGLSSYTVYKVVSDNSGGGAVTIGASQPGGSSNGGGSSSLESSKSSGESTAQSSTESSTPSSTPSSSTEPSSTPSSTPTTPSSTPSPTPSSTPSSTPTTPSSTPTTPSSTPPSTTTEPKSTTPISTPSPSTVVSIVSGQTTILVTVAPTSTSSSSSNENASTTSSSQSSTSTSQAVAPKHSGISGGAIAGIVIGIVAAIAVIVATLLFLRRRRTEDDTNQYVPGAKSSTQSFGDPFVTRAEEDKVLFGPADDFMAVDQRLNPVMLGERRLSEGSLADDRDYSRTILRVANPDA